MNETAPETAATYDPQAHAAAIVEAIDNRYAAAGMSHYITKWSLTRIDKTPIFACRIASNAGQKVYALHWADVIAWYVHQSADAGDAGWFHLAFLSIADQLTAARELDTE